MSNLAFGFSHVICWCCWAFFGTQYGLHILDEWDGGRMQPIFMWFGIELSVSSINFRTCLARPTFVAHTNNNRRYIYLPVTTSERSPCFHTGSCNKCIQTVYHNMPRHSHSSDIFFQQILVHISPIFWASEATELSPKLYVSRGCGAWCFILGRDAMIKRHFLGTVKCTLVQALRLCTGHTAHRGSSGIALFFHDHSTRRGWGVSVTFGDSSETLLCSVFMSSQSKACGCSVVLVASLILST
jgi:hypothetical protein